MARCPATTMDLTPPARRTGSRVEATMARHRVMRVQARSMSPRSKPGARAARAAEGSGWEGVFVMRVEARRPRGSAAGTGGGAAGHHATTGTSGSRKGTTRVSVCSAATPQGRSTRVSPAPASCPTRISASRCPGTSALTCPSRERGPGGSASVGGATTAMMRQGWSREAPWAASSAASRPAPSVPMTRVSTREPPAPSAASSPETMRSVVVAVSTVIMSASRCGRRGRAGRGPPPAPRSRAGTPAAGRPRPSAR